MASYGQKPAEYQFPPYDFVVFSSNTSRLLVTQTKFDEESLRHSIESAWLMGVIPPSTVTFYKNGIQTGQESSTFILIGSLSGNEFSQKPLVKKTETFLSLDKYENMREELQRQGNAYILKEESNHKEYVLTWYEWAQEAKLPAQADL